MAGNESPWGPWEAASVTEAARLLAAADGHWMVAGGWAVELAVGHPVRSRSDIDILLLRKDQNQIHRVLAGWDLHAADPPGTLRPWLAGEWLPADDWVSHRDARIRRPFASLRRLNRDGIPFLALEIQLFYKSTNPRLQDQTDFEVALPCLDSRERQWLDRALELTAVGHPWRDRLLR